MKSLKSYVKKVLRKIKHKYVYFTRTSKTSTLRNDQPYAIVNCDAHFRSWANGRHVYLISKYLEYAGYKVLVTVDYAYIAGNITYKEKLLRTNAQFVSYSDTPINTITLVMPNGGRKEIKLFYGDQAYKEHIDCMAPYPMHPNQYKSPTSHFTSLRGTDRVLKIFFAGNVNEKAYRNENLEKTFGVISRYKVLQHLKNKFSQSGSFKVVSDKTELYQLTNSNTYQNKIIISEARTDSGDWLKILSKADFFFAPPGVVLPWCHNAVEALSVGTIPILQYADRFTPALVHMEHCLSYTNLENLEWVIETALTMAPEEIARMRRNALRYFDQHLSVESVINRIKTFSDSEKQQVAMGVPFVLTKTKTSKSLSPQGLYIILGVLLSQLPGEILDLSFLCPFQ